MLVAAHALDKFEGTPCVGHRAKTRRPAVEVFEEVKPQQVTYGPHLHGVLTGRSAEHERRMLLGCNEHLGILRVVAFAGVDFVKDYQRLRREVEKERVLLPIPETRLPCSELLVVDDADDSGSLLLEDSGPVH